MKYGQRRLGKLTRAATLAVARIKVRGKRRRGKQFNTIFQALRYYCTHTTLHGLRYVVDPDLHVIERFLWLVLFVMSSTVASNVIYSLALRFQVKITYKKVSNDNSYIYDPSKIRIINYLETCIIQWLLSDFIEYWYVLRKFVLGRANVDQHRIDALREFETALPECDRLSERPRRLEPGPRTWTYDLS